MRTIAVTAIVVVLAAVGTGVAASSIVVSRDSDRNEAAHDLQVKTIDRDALQKDVAVSTKHLDGFKDSLGHSALPVRGAQVKPPRSVEETLPTGDLAIGDFRDVFIDEGIVVRGIDAKEVDKIELRDLDTVPPEPQDPREPGEGYRLLRVEIFVTNRSGDAADPACGLSGSFNGSAITATGDRALLRQSYDAIGTYPTACTSGLADGASGRIILPVSLREGERLSALEFVSLGKDDADTYTQTLVFARPI